VKRVRERTRKQIQKYVTGTFSPGLRVEVSRRIREEFENGRDYYVMHGREIQLPRRPFGRPSADMLRWHNDEVFR
jgi:putative restriction endonuclease